MKIFYLFLFTVLLTNVSLGQEIILIQDYISIRKNKRDGGALKLYLPATLGSTHQVLSTDYSIEPDSVYNTDGCRYAKWDLKNLLEKEQIEIKTIVSIQRIGLDVAKKRKRDFVPELNLDEYLEQSDLASSHIDIICAVAEILKGKNEVESVENIYQYITTDEDIAADNAWTKTVKRKGQESRECAELMSALCKAIGIAARLISGKRVSPFWEIAISHWVEVYTHKYGWVQIDPFDMDPKNRLGANFRRDNLVFYNYNEEIKGDWPLVKPDGSVKAKLVSKWGNVLQPDFDEAMRYYRLEDHQKALAKLDELIYLSPYNYRYHMFKGVTLARQGKFDEGLKSLQFAINNTYTDWEKNDILYGFANFYALKNDPKMAMSHLKEAIKYGFEGAMYLREDKDLESLKDLDEFKEIIRSSR